MTVVGVPEAVPVPAMRKSPASTLKTGSLKITVKVTLPAVVGPGVLGVLETIVGAV